MNCPRGAHRVAPIWSRKARYSELSSGGAQSRLEDPPLYRPLAPHSAPKPAMNWRVLGLLNLYRVLAPLMLLALYPLGTARGFTIDSRPLFFGATIAYLGFGIGNIILVRRRLASLYVQTLLQAVVDLTLL